MSDILDEASAVVQCKECPWYKTCVTPMRFSPEDMRRQLQQAAPGGLPFSDDTGFGNLFASISSAAQNILLEGCPIFIQRLRASPRLAERIKRMMQEWGSEAEETA